MWGQTLTFPDDNGCIQFTSFSHNSVTYELGDDVCMYAADGPLLVGKLVACFRAQQGEPMLQVRWFQHAVPLPGESHSECEVVELEDMDVNPVACVAHKARVFRASSWADALHQAEAAGFEDRDGWYWVRTAGSDPGKPAPGGARKRSSRKAVVASIAAVAGDAEEPFSLEADAAVYSATHMLQHPALADQCVLAPKRRRTADDTQLGAKPRLGRPPKQQQRPMQLPQLMLPSSHMEYGRHMADSGCPSPCTDLVGDEAGSACAAGLAQLLAAVPRSPSPMGFNPAPVVVHGDGISRRCVECSATQTPQWREGPTGPKTLCNACGVRYGRQQNRAGKRMGGAGVSRAAAQTAAAAARSAAAGAKRKAGVIGAPAQELVRLTAGGQLSTRPVRQAAVLAANRTAEFARTGHFPGQEEARASAANHQYHHHQLAPAASHAQASATSSPGGPPSKSSAVTMPLVPAGCMQLPRLTSSGPASSHLGSVANLSGLAAFGGLAPVSISQQAARTSSVALLLSPTGSNTATMTALPSMAAMALGLGAGDAGAAPHPSPADASLSVPSRPASAASGSVQPPGKQVDLSVSHSLPSQHSTMSAQEALECPHLSHGDEEDDGLEALGLEASSSGMLFAQAVYISHPIKSEEPHGSGMGPAHSIPWSCGDMDEECGLLPHCDLNDGLHGAEGNTPRAEGHLLGGGNGFAEGCGGNGLLMAYPGQMLASPAKLLFMSPGSHGGVGASPSGSRSGLSLLGGALHAGAGAGRGLSAAGRAQCQAQLPAEQLGGVLGALSDCVRSGGLQLQGPESEEFVQGLASSSLMSAGDAVDIAASEAAHADAALAKVQQVMHSRQADAEHARTLAASAVSRMRTLVDSLVAQHPHLAGDHELQAELAGALSGMGPDALDVMGEGSAPTTATACEAVEEGACTLGDYVMGMGSDHNDMTLGDDMALGEEIHSLADLHDDELMLSGLQPAVGLHEREDDGLGMLVW